MSQSRILNLTGGRLIIQQGDDLELDSKEILPYEVLNVLGHGASAYVEKVRDVHTGLVFARKTYRNVYARTLRDAKNQFRKELRILHKLQHHHHIIQLYATYVAQRELAIILHPVADSGDLTSYLNDYTENYHGRDISNLGRRSRRAILRKAFGCLASTLVFIHDQAVRHKDIKPQNVLIHEGNIFFTDFGISFDFQDQGSTTIGDPHSRTRRYCAPEVEFWDKRNRKSDIFSLGCVFIEILAALEPDALPESLLVGPFFETFNQIPFDTELPISLRRSYHGILSIVRNMMDPDPQRRPLASGITESLMKMNMTSDWFCGECLSTYTPHRPSVPLPISQHPWRLDRTRAIWLVIFIMTITLLFFRQIGSGRPVSLQDPIEETFKKHKPSSNQASVSPDFSHLGFAITNRLLEPSLGLSTSSLNDSVFFDTLSYAPSQHWYFSKTSVRNVYRINSLLKGDSVSLDIYNQGGYGVGVRLSTTAKNNGQHWDLIPLEEGGVKFKNRLAGPDHFLGVDKDNLSLKLSAGDTWAYHWTLIVIRDTRNEDSRQYASSIEQ